MKIYSKILLLAVVLTTFQSNVHAQKLHDSQWSVRPRLVTNNVIVTAVGTSLLGIVEDSDAYKYLPEITAMFPVGVSINTPTGKMVFDEASFWKRFLLGGFTKTPKINYRAGLEVMYQKRTFPIAVYVNCDYMYDKYIMRETFETDFTKYIRQGVSGTFGNRVFIGSIFNRLRPVIDAGVTYNYYFKYKGSYDGDLNAINNGLSFIVGIGIENQQSRRCVMLRYERQCYDYFNNDFTPDGGVTFPYKDHSSRFGAISVVCTWNL